MNMKHKTNWIVVCLSLPLIDVVAFGVNLFLRPELLPAGRVIETRCLARKNDDSTSEDGMDAAFRQLEQLISSGNDHLPPLLEQRKKEDGSSSKEVRELLVNPSIHAEEEPKTAMMSEMALFKDMLSEVSETTETELIEKLKNELEELSSPCKESDDRKSETEIFMELVLDQALKQAEIEVQAGIDKESLLENKEIMKEIAMIFEKANAELMEGIEEIRKEQMALVVEHAARNAKLSQHRMDDKQERLAAAEENMRKMLVKVTQETKNVEAAIEDLKRAQIELQGGVDDKLMNLKRGGIAKQATLVGASLFALRSIVEGFAFVGGDTSHLIPAVLQGAIAVVCFVAFVFL